MRKGFPKRRGRPSPQLIRLILLFWRVGTKVTVSGEGVREEFKPQVVARQSLAFRSSQIYRYLISETLETRAANTKIASRRAAIRLEPVCGY
jgi:hypothetical protein